MPRTSLLGVRLGTEAIHPQENTWFKVQSEPDYLSRLSCSAANKYPSGKGCGHAHHTRRGRPAQATYPLPPHHQGAPTWGWVPR